MAAGLDAHASSQDVEHDRGWLAGGARHRHRPATGPGGARPAEQLPIVLQVLLSQVHRLRALALLARFVDTGAWAVDLALSVGIFPYVLKLLQTTAADLRGTLVFIWAKVLALDPTCQADLVKDGGHLYFLRQLDAPDAGTAAAAAQHKHGSRCRRRSSRLCSARSTPALANAKTGTTT